MDSMWRGGYSKWINEEKRKYSPEVDYGVWWRTAKRGVFARISWIENTGELYALMLGTDKFMVIGVYKSREEVEKLLEGWPEMMHNVKVEELAERIRRVAG